MTIQEFNQWLDERDMYYYESGAYYDSSRESFDENTHELAEQMGISIIEL